MHAFRIIIFSALLLILSACARAQEVQYTDSLDNEEREDTSLVEPEIFDMTGTPLGDTMEAFSADSIIRIDTSAAARADTVSDKDKKHSPLRAVWMSAVLPGLGQAYNKKYWKIGVIYAGFTGLSIGLAYLSNDFETARSAYRRLVRGEDATYNGSYYPVGSDPSTVKAYRDYYKGYLNILALVTALWYGLNLIDAAVDGHLYNYNMSDNLSLNFDPSFHIENGLGLNQACLGLTMTLVPLAGKRSKRKLWEGP